MICRFLSLSLSVCFIALSAPPTASAQSDDYSDIDRQIKRENRDRERRTNDYSDLDRQIERDDYSYSDSRRTSPYYDTYFTVGGAAVFAGDSDLTQFDGVATNGEATLEFDTDYGIFGTFGGKSGAFRTEGELYYRDLQVDRIDSPIGDLLLSGGQIDAISSMFNVYYDTPITDRLEIFVGGGLGIVFLSGDFTAGAPGVGALFLSGDSVEFAYQGMFGLATRVADNVYLTAGYRIFSFTDPDFDGNEYDAPLVQSVDLGLRFTF